MIAGRHRAMIAHAREDGMAKGTRTPKITAEAMAGAEKLASVRYTRKERVLALRTIGLQVARERNRRKVVLDNALGPACVFEPLLPGTPVPATERVRRSAPTQGRSWFCCRSTSSSSCCWRW